MQVSVMKYAIPVPFRVNQYYATHFEKNFTRNISIQIGKCNSFSEGKRGSGEHTIGDNTRTIQGKSCRVNEWYGGRSGDRAQSATASPGTQFYSEFGWQECIVFGRRFGVSSG